MSDYSEHQMEYIDSVDGEAHQSAVAIIGYLEKELAKFTRPENPATIGSAEEDKRPDLNILDVMQRLAIFMQETDLKFDVSGHYGRSLLQLRNTSNIVDLPHNIDYKAIRLIVESLS